LRISAVTLYERQVERDGQRPKLELIRQGGKEARRKEGRQESEQAREGEV
jgi:hypothetical protein